MLVFLVITAITGCYGVTKFVNKSEVNKLKEENKDLKETLLSLPIDTIFDSSVKEHDGYISKLITDFSINPYLNYLDFEQYQKYCQNKKYSLDNRLIVSKYTIKQQISANTIPLSITDVKFKQSIYTLVNEFRLLSMKLGLTDVKEAFLNVSCNTNIRLEAESYYNFNGSILNSFKQKDILIFVFAVINSELSKMGINLDSLFITWLDYIWKYNSQSPAIALLFEYTILYQLGVKTWYKWNNHYNIACLILSSVMGYQVKPAQTVCTSNPSDTMNIDAFADFCNMYLSLLDEVNVREFQNGLILKINKQKEDFDDFNYLTWLQGDHSIYQTVFSGDKLEEKFQMINEIKSLPQKLQDILNYKAKPTVFDELQKQYSVNY